VKATAIKPMIGSERAKEIALNAGVDDDYLREFTVALDGFSAVGPDDDGGSLPARAAWAIFSHRAETARAGRIDVRGIDRVVERLAALPPDEPVLLFPLENAQRVYTIFIAERDERLIGCLQCPETVP